MRVLAIDVGAGTQDILLYDEGMPLEGSTKMILPSQTVVVAGRIDRARAKSRDAFLEGPVMGGGSSTEAIEENIRAGLRVYATPSAAATVHDNLERVRARGVIIQEEAPRGAEVVRTGDLDLPSLKKALGLFEVEVPGSVAVAVQDHGFSPSKSNRLIRFEHMAKAIKDGGRLENFAFRQPPEAMTRMRAVKDYLDGQGVESVLMDTGPAAIFGMPFDPRYREPALAVNFGNGHTIMAVVDGGRIRALVEDHTFDMTPEKIEAYARGLARGTLTNQEVFDNGGHGAYVAGGPWEIKTISVTGPRREEFLKAEALPGDVAVAPGGDMMIAGCLGLVEAWKRKDSLCR
jgi:uncharacterized protein (DUF1786 family)